MGRPAIDLTGMRFGRLLVIRRGEYQKDRPARWVCKCDCGGETVAYSSNLRKEKHKSCGCLLTEAHTKHGMCSRENKDRFYRTWQMMKARCYKEYHHAYKNYGGRGISICSEWHDPEAFILWARENYIEGCTLDRIDNNGNYSPDNCRYATWKQQANNRRTGRQAKADYEKYQQRRA